MKKQDAESEGMRKLDVLGGNQYQAESRSHTDVKNTNRKLDSRDLGSQDLISISSPKRNQPYSEKSLGRLKNGKNSLPEKKVDYLKEMRREREQRIETSLGSDVAVPKLNQNQR